MGACVAAPTTLLKSKSIILTIFYDIHERRGRSPNQDHHCLLDEDKIQDVLKWKYISEACSIMLVPKMLNWHALKKLNPYE